ncbi:MAG: PAS domain S-box protein, partial [Phycisphaerae bacterium]
MKSPQKGILTGIREGFTQHPAGGLVVGTACLLVCCALLVAGAISDMAMFVLAGVITGAVAFHLAAHYSLSRGEPHPTQVRWVVESMPTAVVEMDLKSNILFGNRLFRQMFDVTVEQLRDGLSVEQFMSRKDLIAARRRMQRISGGELSEGPREYRLYRANGERFVAVVNTHPVRRRGTIVGL